MKVDVEQLGPSDDMLMMSRMVEEAVREHLGDEDPGAAKQLKRQIIRSIVEREMEEAISDPTLTEDQVVVLLAISSLMDPDTGITSCTDEELCAQANKIREAMYRRH